MVEEKLSSIIRPPSRRSAREWAVQILFLLNANTGTQEPLENIFTNFWKMDISEFTSDSTYASANNFDERRIATLRTFTEKLVRGTWENVEAIDEKITHYLKNWTIDRVGNTEKAVLRLAFYELFYDKTTPQKVVLNEAVDIVKFFSVNASGSFVNGILNSAIKDIQ